MTEPETTADVWWGKINRKLSPERFAILKGRAQAYLQGQPELRAADVAVPGDPSSAAFLTAAALLVPGSRLTIAGVGLNETRGGVAEHHEHVLADERVH